MKREIAVVMDPIGSIAIAKDSTFAMLLAAQRRNHKLLYLELADVFARGSRAYGRFRTLEVMDRANGWYRFLDEETRPLDSVAAILMRKDPPFDMEYVYATYLLEDAQQRGTLVVNDPRSLRDANEKIFATRFEGCCPPTLVTRRRAEIDAFRGTHQDIILKPLDAMGGASVFRVRPDDPNYGVIVETMTRHETRFCMAQRFIPEITHGDKRILVLDGEVVPYALARIPKSGETRGNLAAGGTAKGRPLDARDREIVAAVAPELASRGILFAGLDVIGSYLTEINITSPTCIRELDALYGLDIAGDLLERLEARLT